MDIRRSKTETLAPLLAEMVLPQSQNILETALSLLSRNDLAEQVVSRAAYVFGIDLPSMAVSEALKSRPQKSVDVVELATLEVARSLNVDSTTVRLFLEAERHPGQSAAEETLYDELAGLTGTLQMARALDFDGVPMLTSEGDDETRQTQPVFDFTSKGALAALVATVPDFELPEPRDDTRGFWPSVRKAVIASPMTTIVPSVSATLGAFDLFGATLEARLLSFLNRNSLPPSGQINYTLETKMDKLIVDWFPQARYRPIQFGLSKLAQGMLKTGYYGFQTHSTGSPPPIIDPSVHQVDSQHKKGYSSAF